MTDLVSTSQHHFRPDTGFGFCLLAQLDLCIIWPSYKQLINREKYRMTIRKVALMGEPILSHIAKPVKDPTAPEIARLVEDMKHTLVDLGGSWLAAPQVFESLRLVVQRQNLQETRKLTDEANPCLVYVNPVLTITSKGMISGWERCHSIPGMHGKVPRYKSLQITYQTLDGSEVTLDTEGYQAALLQHECDHLDGILYPMRMNDLSKLEFNTAPGFLAKDVAEGMKVWPVLQDMVDIWPGHSL
jgi:peptide deformylase